MSTQTSLVARLERAEASLAALTRELSAIRAELADALDETVRSERPPDATRAATPPRPAPRHAQRATRNGSSLDLERLVGRYGMLGIAVVAALAAVGTFLSWAISHGYLTLGPGARVLIGLASAAAVGAWGLKLRTREKSFGSSVVGLALVIVLVCAYAAGPGFHLVPTWVAFAGSTAVAWTLAIFARGQDDEPLWCVAFGGAALAPFVTSDDTGNLYGLMAYALVLLLSACFAISHRQWPVAWRVFYASSGLFVASTTWMADSRGALGVAAAVALPLVIGAAGILPFAPDARKRAALRWLAILALLATSAIDAGWIGADAWLLTGEVLLAVALWLFIIYRLRGVKQASLLALEAPRAPILDWVDGAVIPLLFALRAAALTAPGLPTSAVYAVVAAMFFVMACRHPVGSARDAAAGALMVAAIAVLVEISPAEPVVRVAELLGLALGALVMHRLRPSLVWVVAGVALLASAASMSTSSLIERPRYRIPPFATVASFTALMVTATLVVIARFWRWVFDATREGMTPRPRRAYSDGVRALVRAAVAAPWMWGFVWVLIELAMSYSPSTSTLLLVTYFAATAVVSVAVGRLRRSALLRRIGLGLAITAAATSVYGAGTYFDIGIRIVAYLVTSAFLLGIAYWYRRPGAATANA